MVKNNHFFVSEKKTRLCTVEDWLEDPVQDSSKKVEGHPHTAWRSTQGCLLQTREERSRGEAR